MTLKPDPLIVTRTFSAPRTLVFEAFSTAEHIKQWFSPEGLTTPEADVDFRPGGVFAVCMRMPDGTDHWTRGTFVEVSPYDRIVFAGDVSDGGEKRFAAHTTITLEEDGAGTKLTMCQAYEIYDETFLAAIQGAPEGWRTTLNKLERLLATMKESETPAAHDHFTIERTLDASPARVFAAFATKVGKTKWFAGPEGWTLIERVFDFRPGGRERLTGRHPSGMVTQFDAVYFEIVPDRRIVYAYEMHLNDQRISVSLATIEMTPEGAGTHFKVTEQGVFLNGFEDADSQDRGTLSRQHGTQMLMDRMAASLAGA